MTKQTNPKNKTLMDFVSTTSSSAARILIALSVLIPIITFISWYLYFEFDFNKDTDPVGMNGTYSAASSELYSEKDRADNTLLIRYAVPEEGTIKGVTSTRWAFNDSHLLHYNEDIYSEDGLKLFKVLSYRRLNNEGDRFNSLGANSDEQLKISMCGGTGYTYKLPNTELDIGNAMIVNKYIGSERTTVFILPEIDAQDERYQRIEASFNSLTCQ